MYEDDSNPQIGSLSLNNQEFYNNTVPIENLYQQTSLSLNVNNVINYVSHNNTTSENYFDKNFEPTFYSLRAI